MKTTFSRSHGSGNMDSADWAYDAAFLSVARRRQTIPGVPRFGV